MIPPESGAVIARAIAQAPGLETPNRNSARVAMVANRMTPTFTATHAITDSRMRSFREIILYLCWIAGSMSETTDDPL